MMLSPVNRNMQYDDCNQVLETSEIIRRALDEVKTTRYIDI